MRQIAVFILSFMFIFFNATAYAGENEVFLCVDANGNKNYKNSGEAEGCKRIDLGNPLSKNWTPVVVADESTTYVDSATISKKGQYKKAWFLRSYNKPQAINNSLAKFKSEAQLVYFSCDERSTETIQFARYAEENAGGDVVNSGNYRFDQQTMREVVPNSIGESMLLRICKSTTNKSNVTRPGARERYPSNSLGQARLSPSELNARKNGKEPAQLAPDEIKRLGF